MSAAEPQLAVGPALPAEFFARATLQIAQELVGCLLVHDHPRGRLLTRIVETEGYTENDPACHAWGVAKTTLGKTPRRGAALFGKPGTAYVYLNYGIHWLLNVVTEPEGTAGAVLIRAVEPLAGLPVMQALRANIRQLPQLTNGPAKLTAALGVGREFHGLPLTAPPLFFAPRPSTMAKPIITASPRIGISQGAELPWRYFAAGNPFVSPSPLNKLAQPLETPRPHHRD